MNIGTGLFNSMVLQRNRRNVSEGVFSGTCDCTGSVVVSVTKRGKKVSGYSSRPVGNASRGRFAGCIEGLPAGGPYEIELTINDGKGGAADRMTVRDVLVGDVWILGGQSNMQGCGRREDRLPPNPMVRAFYMNDCWATALDPIHNLWDAVDQIHTDLNGGIGHSDDHLLGVGPGVAFGQHMYALTGVPQGLLACGHGGTSMGQWDPKLKKLGGKSLYGATVRRFIRNGSKIAGVVWYQGCSDANQAAAPLYTKRMKELISAFRRDTHDARLPIAVVQISRVVGWGDDVKYWNSVQDQERLLSSRVQNCTVVPAIDLALDDGIHISGKDQQRLGRRLADAMHVLREGRSAGMPPIALGKVSIEEERGRGCGNIVVEFANVVGGLRAGSRPAGFSLVDRNGMSFVYDIALDGKRAVVRSSFGFKDVGELSLHYGHGVNPYCNITDAADRPLPVFGPLHIGKPRALTPFVQVLRVSAFQPGAGRLHKLECPDDLAPLNMLTRTFSQIFCDLHDEISKTAPKDLVVFYACRILCSEDMGIEAHMGYDGPIKAWFDRREVFHDPNGTNPAIAGAARVPIAANQGEHELIVALGTNESKAWGIFLNFERKDLPLSVLRQGPSSYAMPRILG